MFKNYIYHSKVPSKKVTFEVYDVDLAIVNGIRRVILSDIPVVGICGEPYDDTTVHIEKNNGPLHNEFMIHRIGLVPLHLNETETEAFDEDNDYEIRCDVEHSGSGTKNVTSRDFRIFKKGHLLEPKEHERIFPVNSVTQHAILLTRLRTNEALKFKATLTKNTASYHASFSPVSVCTYQFMVDPKNKSTNPLEKERAYIKNTFGEPTQYMMHIEPVNGLTVKYIVKKAIDILIEKLQKISINIEEKNITYTMLQPNRIQFTFQKETDTLGNLLQSMMHNDYIRNKHPARAFNLTFVGYNCPHPLEATMLLSINLEGNTQPIEEDFVGVLKDSADRIRITLEDIRASWLRFVP